LLIHNKDEHQREIGDAGAIVHRKQLKGLKKEKMIVIL
jgi:hypothetical protein